MKILSQKGRKMRNRLIAFHIMECICYYKRVLNPTAWGFPRGHHESIVAKEHKYETYKNHEKYRLTTSSLDVDIHCIRSGRGLRNHILTNRKRCIPNRSCNNSRAHNNLCGWICQCSAKHAVCNGNKGKPRTIPVAAEEQELIPEINQDQTEETPSPVGEVEEEVEETAVTESEPIAVSILLKWDYSTEDDLIRIGNDITLVAELKDEAASLPLQWQVASKPTQDLVEGEPEWEDISGAHGQKYIFTVKEGMQSWRWRLRVATPDGGMVYSDEMRLPKLAQAEGELEIIDDPETPLGVGGMPLPIAAIALSATVPLDEITFGDEVMLTADIANPCEGMLLQWQYIPDGVEPAEEAWQSIEGATETIYSYVMNEENTGWLWRLLITVPETIEQEEPMLDGDETVGVDTDEAPLCVPQEATEPAAETIAEETPEPAVESILEE